MKEAWNGMGPTGRVGVVLGIAGAVVAFAAWFVAAATWDRAASDPYASYYTRAGITNTDGMPREAANLIRRHVAALSAATVGLVLAFAGVVVALLNANRETPPPAAKLAVRGASYGVAVAALAWILSHT